MAKPSPTCWSDDVGGPQGAITRMMNLASAPAAAPVPKAVDRDFCLRREIFGEAFECARKSYANRGCFYDMLEQAIVPGFKPSPPGKPRRARKPVPAKAKRARRK
jgi:hypothetical protein